MLILLPEDGTTTSYNHSAMNVGTYLERIHHTLYLKPDVATLHELQLAHLRSVPFENLDIGLKRVIQINEPDIWNKLVVNKAPSRLNNKTLRRNIGSPPYRELADALELIKQSKMDA